MKSPQEKIQAFVEEEMKKALWVDAVCSVCESEGFNGCKHPVEDATRILRRAIRLGLELGREAGPEKEKKSRTFQNIPEENAIDDSYCDGFNSALDTKNAAITDLMKSLE